MRSRRGRKMQRLKSTESAPVVLSIHAALTTISTRNATWCLDPRFGSSGQKQPRNGAVQTQRHDPRHNQTTITGRLLSLKTPSHLL
jgi:hypothetical protein